ncbi:MAG: iron(III) transport system permease protein, partial [Acidimicrobiia bacterium]|nr:iron(III) transport system permease protein [Acidimicrobiia bacterium]
MTATAGDTVSPQRRGRSWERGRGSRRPPLLLLVPSLAAAGVALMPLWYLAARALDQGWGYVVAEVAQARTLTLIRRSLMLAAAVTCLCMLIGTSAAWLVVRTDLPLRRLWHVLLTLPLAVPSYVSAYLWLSWRRSIAGFAGAVLVLTLASYPYVYLPVTAALRRLDPAQEEVARALGHGSARVFLRVTLRQVLPAVSAGALL